MSEETILNEVTQETVTKKEKQKETDYYYFGNSHSADCRFRFSVICKQ